MTGSFTVNAISIRDYGYVESLDATFEQYCEGGGLPLTSHVVITNPPPPPLLEIGLAIANSGTVSKLDGAATIHGTVTCPAPVVEVNGNVTQVVKGVSNGISFTTQLDCSPGTPVPWDARALADNPFQRATPR